MSNLIINTMQIKEKIALILGEKLLTKEELHGCAEKLVSDSKIPSGYLLEILCFFKRNYHPKSWMYVSRLSEAIEKFDYICQMLLKAPIHKGSKQLFYGVCSCAYLYPEVVHNNVFEQLFDKFT